MVTSDLWDWVQKLGSVDLKTLRKKKSVGKGRDRRSAESNENVWKHGRASQVVLEVDS